MTTTPPLRSSERMVLVVMACAFGCLTLAVLMGGLAALYYIPALARPMASVGISLVQLRPLHTTFASAWVFLGCVAMVYRFLADKHGAPTRGDRRLFRFHMTCWGLAGAASLVTLFLGVTSGREYLGFHPLIALLIYVGWLAFAWTYLRKVWRGFWSQPVYVYMWTAGVLLFLYAFGEGQAHLLPFVGERPLADLQIQWKSCGTLVASFNQMVYGALMYMAERQTRDKGIAQSRAAFALLAIGLLNSLTNYGHHTYHLPQDHLIKWISFGVSMLEVILLWRVLSDVIRLSSTPGRTRPHFVVWRQFTELALRWNLFLLTLAVLISVPTFNAMIHGTHVVMAHAMGSMLAIDTYILLGVFAWLLAQVFPKAEVRAGIIDSPAARRAIAGLNASLICTVAVLLIEGLVVGYTHRMGEPAPGWLDYFPLALAFSGGGVGYHLLRLMQLWLPLLRDSARHKLFRNDPRWPHHVAEKKQPVE